MFIEVPNFGETEAKDAPIGGSFELVPEGEYVVVVESASPDTNSNGKPYIKMRFEIESNGDNGPSDHAGRYLFDNWYYGGKSLPYFKGKWAKTGAQWSDSGFDTDALIGRKVIVTVRHEKYKTTDDNGAALEKTATRVENYREYVPPRRTNTAPNRRS